MDLNQEGGKKVAQAIDRRIMNVAKEIYKNSPYTLIKYGIVKKIDGKFYTLQINKSLYTKVCALKGVGQINVNDVVICIIPNNQFSNMFILGVLDTI